MSLTKLQPNAAIYATPQIAVVTSLNLERTPAIAKRLLVKWLTLEIRDIKRTSGGTLAISVKPDRGMRSEVPSGVKTDLGLKNRVVSEVMGFVTTASASAKASECSKMVMPTSGVGWRPCRAHESVSTNCPKQRDKKRGHRTASDPFGLAVSLLVGNMSTDRHDASVSSQKRRCEAARDRNPPSPLKSVPISRPGAPYCNSDHEGSV